MFTRKQFQIVAVLFIILMFLGNSFAQEWTAEQKDAWKTIEKLYENWKNRNLEGYIDCMHEDFSGWYQNGKVPLSKVSLKKHEKVHFSTETILLCEVNPIVIQISGGMAIVHFYSTSIRKNEKGQTNRWSKWTHTLKKESGKWLIIGVHGGSLPD